MSAQVKHSAQCLANEAKYAAYLLNWPNYCRHCDGSGSHYYYGTHDSPPEWEDCSYCAGDLICPRCGKPDALNEDGADLCQFCGWTPENVAPVHECYCNYDIAQED